MKSVVQERRQFSRSALPTRVGVSLLQPGGPVSADSVNFSEGGLCLRLQEMLEIRSLVRLQLTPGRSGAGRFDRTVECTGRVAWVIQRLDLRPIPPFLFEVGIEFVDPPPTLRQLIAQRGGTPVAFKDSDAREKPLESCAIRGREFVARLVRAASHPSQWHLVVSVEGAPCFSGHYPTEREAVAAWARFKREQIRR